MSLTSNPAGSDIVASPPLFTSVAAPARLADAAASGAPAVQTTVTPSAPSAASITDNGSPPQVGTAPLAVRQPEVSPIDAKASSLSPDEIAMLLKRGKADLTDGDISAARLLLQRAAEAGNAEAALALGSTFDPLMIARLDTFGMQADVAKARAWYQRAARLGSTLAAQQLANLARAGE